MIIQEPVQAAIWHCLNHYDYQDAIFLAERLCAEVETDETIFILATCYYRASNLHQAYWLLHTKTPRSPQCRYLLAKCAFRLKKLSEAEAALSNVNFGELKNFDDLSKEFGEVACFALQLIAKICAKTERYTIAAEAYKKALKLNPFLWQAFADLCNFGEKVDPNAIFQFPNTDIFNTCQGNNSNSMVLFGLGGYPDTCITAGADTVSNSQNSCNYILSTPVDQMSSNCANLVTPNNNLNNSPIGVLCGGNFSYNGDEIQMERSYFCDSINSNSYGEVTPFRKQFKYLSKMGPLTPSFGVLPLSPSETSVANLSSSPIPQTLVEANQEKSIGKKLKGHVGNIISRKDTPLQNSKPAVFTQTGNITPRGPNTITAQLAGQNVRRSSRLFSNNYSVKENNKSPNINKFPPPKSPQRRNKPRIKISMNNEINEKDKKEKEKIETITSNDSKVLLNNTLNSAQTMAHHVLSLKKQSAEGLMALLRDLGQGYQHLAQFNCKEAISIFQAVPKHHFRSSWVQSMIALAYYEQREYEAAANIFREIHENEPNRLDYMEIYSTALWHLQREVALSALAQSVMALDKNSPITWCVAGNCFSLHKEHETAIKFFKRAVQVNPNFVYSYTLLGHELVITEELDKALAYFRTAIMKDPRHYNAWFGIGTIYSRQARYELAELHYRQALKINPKNSVIMVHIGTMQFFLQKTDQALQTLNAAIEIEPKNPLCKFHRGSMNYSLGKHQEALKELEELKQIVPKESVVFYFIGKIHKTLGNVDLALMHFSWATDLDPKGANNQLKDAFDSINHTPGNDLNVETDLEPISERSDDSTQAQIEQDPSYDSDTY